MRNLSRVNHDPDAEDLDLWNEGLQLKRRLALWRNAPVCGEPGHECCEWCEPERAKEDEDDRESLPED